MIQVDCVVRTFLSMTCLIMGLAFGSGCAAGGAKVEGKVGVVDPARVLSETNAGKKARTPLIRSAKPASSRKYRLATTATAVTMKSWPKINNLRRVKLRNEIIVLPARADQAVLRR